MRTVVNARLTPDTKMTKSAFTIVPLMQALVVVTRQIDLGWAPHISGVLGVRLATVVV